VHLVGFYYKNISVIPPTVQCCTIFYEGIEFFIDGKTQIFHKTGHG